MTKSSITLPRSPRPLRPEERDDALALLEAVLGATPYHARAREVLEISLRGDDPEHASLAMVSDGKLEALALFGAIAGSIGAARLHFALLAAGLPAGQGAGLLDALAERSRARGARFLLAELPDDTPWAASIALLRRCGYTEEARIPDYYRQGIALLFLRRELRESGTTSGAPD